MRPEDGLQRALRTRLSRRGLFGYAARASAIVIATAAGVQWAQVANAETSGVQFEFLPRDKWRRAKESEIPPELWHHNDRSGSNSKTGSAPAQPDNCFTGCCCPCCSWFQVGTCFSDCGGSCGTCGRLAPAAYYQCLDEIGNVCDDYCSATCSFCC